MMKKIAFRFQFFFIVKMYTDVNIYICTYDIKLIRSDTMAEVYEVYIMNNVTVNVKK